MNSITAVTQLSSSREEEYPEGGGEVVGKKRIP